MNQLENMLAAPTTAQQLSVADPLEEIISATSAGPTVSDKSEARQWADSFLQDERARGAMPLGMPSSARTVINARIDEIDRLIGTQMDEVLHHSELQKLEATWRGLRYLVDQTETSNNLKLRILNAPKMDLLRDLQAAPKYDQSALWHQVYETTFDTPGGEPFAALIGDYEFGRHPEDQELLDKISHVSSAAHAPFLAAVSPDLFKLDGFTQLRERPDLSTFFDKPEFAQWNSFRGNNEDSRYVALTMPHILMRLPYGRDTRPVEGFSYDEGVNGTDHSRYLWGNAAYALGARLTGAFARYGWCTSIRGYESGGRVEGLPTHTFPTDEGDTAIKCPTEIAISGRREAELARAGFVPLCHYQSRDFAVFFSVQSCQRPRKYTKEEATASACLSAQLPYLLASCRFAHYLKVMMRNQTGNPMSRKNAEDFLADWIRQYVVSNDDAAADEKRERPLRDARIEVTERGEAPGVYDAIAYLQPHFMLDAITVSLRLVAQVPNVKA